MDNEDRAEGYAWTLTLGISVRYTTPDTWPLLC